ncbi:MAG: hypothetical protein GX481_08980 [Atopobium sp.]|nr:hypothetical protein [Atopobium sp.]
MTVEVLGSSGKRLKLTSSYRARKLIQRGKAVIFSYRPVFTIQLTDREDEDRYREPLPAISRSK